MKLTSEELEILETMFELSEQNFSSFNSAYENRTGEELDEGIFDKLITKLRNINEPPSFPTDKDMPMPI